MLRSLCITFHSIILDPSGVTHGWLKVTENISSIEVEDALYKHPDVVAVGVVAKQDEKWGETPCAFVELREGANVSSEELRLHCKSILAGFKVPGEFKFIEIPKTSTGKIQKFKLRDMLA